MPQKRKQIDENASKASASEKRRALTPPFQQPPKKSPKTRAQKVPITNPQSQSLFFRPPREIRDIIYDEIFVFPTTVHIAYVGGRNRKLRSFLCKRPEQDQPERTREGRLCRKCCSNVEHFNCSTRDPRNKSNVNMTPTAVERRDVRVMAMLRSCRRIYTETIDILYTRNAFSIVNPRTLLELPRYTPQPRLSAFRTLYLTSPVYTDAVTMSGNPLLGWRKVIKNLEKLNGLVDLCVVLQPMYGFQSDIDSLWEPLKEIEIPVRPRVIVATLVKMVPFNSSSVGGSRGCGDGCVAVRGGGD
ncbi:hypothetical protein BJX64DRAFT_291455 [Aspergillus heterothallicus]